MFHAQAMEAREKQLNLLEADLISRGAELGARARCQGNAPQVVFLLAERVRLMFGNFAQSVLVSGCQMRVMRQVTDSVTVPEE